MQPGTLWIFHWLEVSRCLLTCNPSNCDCPGWKTSGIWEGDPSHLSSPPLHSRTPGGVVFSPDTVSSISCDSRLLQHNPHLDWSTATILSWGPTCHVTCLIQSSSDSTLKSQEPLDLSQVPTQYHHLKAVFSKKKSHVFTPSPSI